jgi:hypothetical protein
MHCSNVRQDCTTSSVGTSEAYAVRGKSRVNSNRHALQATDGADINCRCCLKQVIHWITFKDVAASLSARGRGSLFRS